MAQKDYLLRQIEILGEILRAIRKMIMGGTVDSSEIKARLRGVSSQAGMDLELAQVATPDTLRLLVAPSGEIEPGKCWLLAETLYLDGLQAESEGDNLRASDSLLKARMIFSLLEPMGAFLVGFPEASERILEIKEVLAETGLLGDGTGG